MDQLTSILQLVVAVLTLATLVWGLVKMFASAAEARGMRAEAVTASVRAEAAAVSAAAGVVAMAENVQKVEIATNSIKDALIEATKQQYYAMGVKDEKEKISG